MLERVPLITFRQRTQFLKVYHSLNQGCILISFLH